MTNPTQQEKIEIDKRLEEIFGGLSYGYTFQMSDYATSKSEEDEYEKQGLAEIAQAKRETKSLIIELLEGLKYKPLTSLRIVVGGELVSDDAILDLVNRCSTSAVEEARDNLINQLKGKE